MVASDAIQQSFRVLLIEDNPADYVLISEFLEETSNTRVVIEHADRLSRALERMAKKDFDVIILDLTLPDASGLETVTKVHESAPKIPIVVLTGLDNEAMALKAIREGVQDYLVKTKLNATALSNSIRYAVERKRLEEDLRISIAAKETLLQELHHRVKNNLQLILSMLNLQARSMEDGVVKEFVAESQNRIQAIALVHELLYQNSSLTSIDAAHYLESLANSLIHSFSGDAVNISIEYDLTPGTINIDMAVRCGIILNELIVNALRHAFPEQKDGKIMVKFRPLDNGGFVFSVEDDGQGLPTATDIENSSGLGLQLVHALVDELKADLSVNTNGHTKFEITHRPVKRD